MLLGHIVRVGGDHRPVEHSLALPRSLFHEDLHLPGAIVDATFAVRKPPLLEQLQSRDVPYVVDPEALRFGSDAYEDVDRLAALPYAPAAPITSSTTDDDIHRFVIGSLTLQAQVDATAYIAPCLPLDNNGDALKLNRRLVHAARDALGVEVDRRPLIVSVAPATRVLGDPAPIAQMLADVPADGVHVQPLRFRPTELSLATLERYCDYLAALQTLGIGVMAGRVGAFGLVLLALGVDGFDSGLTTAEAFDLNSAIRSARKRRHRDADERPTEGGGRKRRFYLTQLKTTVMAPVMAVVDTPSMRYRFTSSLPCCTGGFGGYLEHAREHCLFARTEEAANLMREAPTLRTATLAAQLAEARDTATVLTRSLAARQMNAPSFEHLERWRRLLLGRAKGARAA
jgi:hypothetical protein